MEETENKPVKKRYRFSPKDFETSAEAKRALRLSLYRFSPKDFETPFELGAVPHDLRYRFSPKDFETLLV